MMKNISKIIVTALTVTSLLVTGCSKKPKRPDPSTTAMGSGMSNTVDPEAFAIPGENINLSERDLNAGTPSGDLSVVEPIYFALDRSAVAAPERPKLDAVIKWLAANPGKNLVLVGHCDWRGTAEYNLGLGDRRANSVKRYLESLGADASRLETLSKGSTAATQSGGEAVWSKDRRVDFVELKRQ